MTNYKIKKAVDPAVQSAKKLLQDLADEVNRKGARKKVWFMDNDEKYRHGTFLKAVTKKSLGKVYVHVLGASGQTYRVPLENIKTWE